jgi:tricorn protease-like protein
MFNEEIEDVYETKIAVGKTNNGLQFTVYESTIKMKEEKTNFMVLPFPIDKEEYIQIIDFSKNENFFNLYENIFPIIEQEDFKNNKIRTNFELYNTETEKKRKIKENLIGNYKGLFFDLNF